MECYNPNCDVELNDQDDVYFVEIRDEGMATVPVYFSGHLFCSSECLSEKRNNHMGPNLSYSKIKKSVSFSKGKELVENVDETGGYS